MKRTLLPVALACSALLMNAPPAPTQAFDDPRLFPIVEATFSDIVAALETKRISSRHLVKLYLDRIAAYEGTLNAMIRVNFGALAVAHQRDVERANGVVRGPCTASRSSLKDNVNTLDMITTGGALAFAGLGAPYESDAVTEAARGRRDHPRQDRAHRARQLGHAMVCRPTTARSAAGPEPLRSAPRSAPLVVNGHHFPTMGGR